MISAPACAPTEVDARPETSRPMPNSTPTTGPEAAAIAACAPSIVSVPGTPGRASAARTSIAMFTVPARARESSTSQREARTSSRVGIASSSSRRRSRASPECR